MPKLEAEKSHCHSDDLVLPLTGPMVVVAYEDSSVPAKLRSVLHRIAEERCKRMGSMTSFWKFDLLNYRPLLDQAVEELTRAEIIILSAHGNSALPPQVTRWLELSLVERTHHASKLIVMLDESAEYTPAADHVLGCLSSIADRAHLHWFPVFSVSGEVPAAFVRLAISSV